jgi:F-type H+-transporting ATPase subunit a
MGEHQTWFDFLHHSAGYRDFSASLQGPLGRKWEALMFADSHWTLIHVLFAGLVMLFVMFGASRFHASVKGYGTAALIPKKSWFNFRNIFEWLCDATFATMVGVMGEKNAKKHFWFIGSLAFFILFSNAMALIPGFGVPTATLKTNVALAGLVFVYYNVCGIMVHGVGGWIKHFMGPVWWLSPLILPIEIVSHLVRPASLALRLMGNMVGDHKVVFSFFSLIPILVPVPFLLLGSLVVIIQTVVFCLLTMVYIAMAVAEDH